MKIKLKKYSDSKFPQVKIFLILDLNNFNEITLTSNLKILIFCFIFNLEKKIRSRVLGWF